MIETNSFVEVSREPITLYKAIMLPLIPALSAGFPSPAADFIDVDIDLTKELIKNPSTTFLGRIRGNSMIEAGIGDGDIVVIDKSLRVKDGCIAVCFLDGEFTVKRVRMDKEGCWLVPENPSFKSLRVTAENDLIIWGIVTNVIKKL